MFTYLAGYVNYNYGVYSIHQFLLFILINSSDGFHYNNMYLLVFEELARIIFLDILLEFSYMFGRLQYLRKAKLINN